MLRNIILVLPYLSTCTYRTYATHWTYTFTYVAVYTQSQQDAGIKLRYGSICDKQCKNEALRSNSIYAELPNWAQRTLGREVKPK